MQVLATLDSRRDRAFAQELIFGTLRFEPRLNAVIDRLIEKPIKRGDLPVKVCLLLGLYQLIYLRTPSHAAVTESVRLVPRHIPWARGFVNGVLRHFARTSNSVLREVDLADVARLAHPAWLLEALRGSWGEEYERIAKANNLPGPLALRVNRRVTNREKLLNQMSRAGHAMERIQHSDWGLTTSRTGDPSALPGFREGAFAVQDGAAQLAAPLLAPRNGERVLDACAAPGGKTGHLAEIAPESNIFAVEIDSVRCQRFRDNLDRLGHKVTVITADASDPTGWWDGQPFDRILLDVPCSSTGVIRRHPDIKVLRKADDLTDLVSAQSRLLRGLWPTLAHGGSLLYATCSVLGQENYERVIGFVAEQTDAVHVPIDAPWGRAMAAGRQIFPGENGMDGFFYALLRKE